MRLVINLKQDEYKTIRELAEQERRDPRDQIVVLAMKALRDTEPEPAACDIRGA